MIDPFSTYGELFKLFHAYEILPDGKLITDSIAISTPEQILAAFAALTSINKENLTDLYQQHFRSPVGGDSNFSTGEHSTIEDHIKTLWQHLKRNEDAHEASSRIPLPHPYIVPGGRFTEIYYWDSYFAMLGLAESGEWDTIRSMLKNFAYLIDQFGHIPNGSRSYFLSRSQPPFFSSMVSLLAEHDGPQVYSEYLDALLSEYAFWMQGTELCDSPYTCHQHVCKVEGGYLNRYYDRKQSPREEMYQDDLRLAQELNKEPSHLYGHIRAACESGWDFSTRWYSGDGLASINTLNILPVDLNCLLYHLESTLSKAYQTAGNTAKAEAYAEIAHNRKHLIDKYFWNPNIGMYTDYLIQEKRPADHIHAGSMFPLFFEISERNKIEQLVHQFKSELCVAGGVRTTTQHSGQQWDAPNGWAPLQYIAVRGLLNSGYKDLAIEIMSNWCKLNERVFSETGKMMEKYNVEDISLTAGGGEYPNQDGFGWTNGVYLIFKQLLKQYNGTA